MKLQIGFRGRLVAAAIIWIFFGLATSWYAIDSIIRGHVIDEFQEELFHHGAELANLIEAGSSGELRLRQALSDHRFYEARSGYYWEIDMDRRTSLLSPSLGDQRMTVDARSISRKEKLPIVVEGIASGTAHLTEGTGPTGTLYLAETDVQPSGSADVAHLRVGIDKALVNELLRKFDDLLGLSLALIAVGLCAAVVAQVTFGLWPLTRVRQGLDAIRLGKARRMPDGLPAEVVLLTDSLNDMIEANDEIVRRARTQAGNLAHALKTPLAILLAEGHRLDAAGLDGTIVLRECKHLQRQIDHQLARTRAAASRGRPYAVIPAGLAISRIVSALSRLPTARRLAFEIDERDCDLSLMCAGDDLDEILGNLIENAIKWAQTRVRVHVSMARDGMALIMVEDDGPGIPVDAQERVFVLGERLDEGVPGSGLGLAIVRDVVELYGGRVWIEGSNIGGTAVHLLMPTTKHIASASKERASDQRVVPMVAEHGTLRAG